MDKKTSIPQKDYKQQLDDAESAAHFLDRIFNAVSDAIVVINPRDYTILTFNRAALKMLGLTEEELLGRRCHQIFYSYPVPCDNFYKTCPIKQVLSHQAQSIIEYEYISKNKQVSYFAVTASPIINKQGQAQYIALILRDISYKRKNELRTKELPPIDHISGLYKQTYFYKELLVEMSRSRRYQRPLCLILANLNYARLHDQLKTVDKNLLLNKLAHFINKNTRKIDLIYQYGEEGFAIILPETDQEQAVSLALRLKGYCQNVIGSINEFNKLLTYSILTLNMGIMEYNGLDDLQVMIKKTEQALLQAQNQADNIFAWEM